MYLYVCILAYGFENHERYNYSTKLKKMQKQSHEQKTPKIKIILAAKVKCENKNWKG